MISMLCEREGQFTVQVGSGYAIAEAVENFRSLDQIHRGTAAARVSSSGEFNNQREIFVFIGGNLVHTNAHR